jgi:hypothetical protein
LHQLAIQTPEGSLWDQESMMPVWAGLDQLVVVAAAYTVIAKV